MHGFFTHLSSVFLLAGKEIIIPNAKLYENETRLSVRCSTIVHYPPLFSCLDLIVSEFIRLLLSSPPPCVLCKLPGISAEHSSEDEMSSCKNLHYTLLPTRSESYSFLLLTPQGGASSFFSPCSSLQQNCAP